MSKQELNRTGIYVAIGGLVVVGGAIIYHLLSAKNEEAAQEAS